MTVGNFGLAAQTWRVLIFHVLTYRASWQGSAVSSFLAPALTLAAMGFGVGALVPAAALTNATSVGGAQSDLSYAMFVVPGILATQVMFLCVTEASYPLMAGFRWTKSLHAMFAAPLSARGIFCGFLAYVALRAVLMSAAFVIVAALLGAARGWSLLLSLPVVVLCAMAHAVVMAVLTTTLTSETAFAVSFRAVVLPMTLFTGAFYPLGGLPEGVQAILWTLPMTHGVDLAQRIALGGALGWANLGSLAYLGVWLAVGLWFGEHAFARRLEAGE